MISPKLSVKSQTLLAGTRAKEERKEVQKVQVAVLFAPFPIFRDMDPRAWHTSLCAQEPA